MSATDKQRELANELKRRSRRISSDMNPEAIRKRLQLTNDLCEAARFLTKASKASRTDSFPARP